MDNKGMNQYRFKYNPKEKIIAELWDEQNSINYYGILDYLLAENLNKPKGEVTDRDRLVAATVIQWLGSPVGNSFLNEYFEKIKNL